MTDNSKDGFALWGFVLIGIFAMGYSYDHFGGIWGNLVLVPIILIIRRMIAWSDDLRYFRRLDEERHQRAQEEHRLDPN